MKTSDFDYSLPPERIAQSPVEPRDSAGLMVINRRSADVEHTTFDKLGDYLDVGDLLVINQTRVIPARLYGNKIPTGGRMELLLLKREEERTWQALVGGKGLVVGRRFQIDGGPMGEVVEVQSGPRRLLRFDSPIEPVLDAVGHVPLPPYIHKPLGDPERYQTVYAHLPGSAAAPTAGLHFTPGLIESLKQQGIHFVTITLHVGLDTFAPVNEETPQDHHIHTEWCQVPPDAADAINMARKRGGRIIAVGTTSVRTLESAARFAQPSQVVAPFEGTTDLFILPGYRFKVVDAMVTNFHLPRSTLIMLVSAFAGRQRVLSAYQNAIDRRYRFYSFGDAMLIL